jgi:hypothetical protein
MQSDSHQFHPRRPSIPLLIAKWLVIIWAGLFFTLLFLALVIHLAGWDETSWGIMLTHPVALLVPLSFSLGPVVLAALLIWHWAAAMLAEQRAMRRELRRLVAAIERTREPR